MSGRDGNQRLVLEIEVPEADDTAVFHAEKRQAAEAALATTRQALTEIAENCTDYVAAAIARRALAATEDVT